jgi:hypothetical protein
MRKSCHALHSAGARPKELPVHPDDGGAGAGVDVSVPDIQPTLALQFHSTVPSFRKQLPAGLLFHVHSLQPAVVLHCVQQSCALDPEGVVGRSPPPVHVVSCW